MAQVDRGVLSEVFTYNAAEAKRKFPSITLQLVKFKKVTEGDKPKLRFTLSDGSHIVQGVQSNDSGTKAEDIEQPEALSFIQLKNFEPFLMSQTRPVLLIFDWEIVGAPTKKVGEPQALSDISNLKKTSTPEPAPAPAPEKKQNPTAKKSTALPANLKRKLGSSIIPIEQLSPYSNAWALRVRVSAKSDIRTYRNQKGEGKLFNCTFIDESGEIRATGFNDKVDAFYEKLQEGSVYYVSKCSVNIAKKQFSNVQNDFELMFDRDTVIEPCQDNIDLPQVQYNFVDLADLGTVENNGNADIMGILKSVGESNEMTSKAGRTFEKRELVLVDQSKKEAVCALWGKTAKDFSGSAGAVLALKGARVSDFGGRSLSVSGSTAMTVDPDIPEAHKLKGWYDREGQNESFGSLRQENMTAGRMDQPAMLIDDAKRRNYGMSETPDFFNIHAAILFIRKQTIMYPACANPSGKCMKKMVHNTDGQYLCERCDMTFEEPNWRYMLTANVADTSGDIWVSFFDEHAQKLLGRPAKDLRPYIESEGDPDAEEELANILSQATGKEYVFRIQARLDTFNDQSGVRYNAQGAQPIEFVSATKKLLDDIEKY